MNLQSEEQEAFFLCVQETSGQACKVLEVRQPDWTSRQGVWHYLQER